MMPIIKTTPSPVLLSLFSAYLIVKVINNGYNIVKLAWTKLSNRHKNKFFLNVL